MIMSFLSSKSSVYCGIIRIHEDKTCEISLLSGPGSSVRSSKTSVFFLQKNLVHPSKETRTPKYSYPIRCFKSDLSGKIHSPAFSQTPSWCRPRKLPPPISSNTAPFYCTSRSSEIAFRTTSSVSRWPLFPFSEKALGTLFSCTQVLYWKNSHVFRSPTTSRKRKCRKMATSLREHTSKGQNSNPRSRGRQSQWHEENCQAPWMGSSALSFSFDPKVSSPTPPAKARFKRRPHEGRNLSIDASNPRGSQWAIAHRFNRSTYSISSQSLYYVSNSGGYKRIPSIHQLLSDLPRLSGTQSTIYNQHHRIHGLHHPGFIETKPFSFQSPITLTMGHGIDSDAKGISL